MTPLPLALTHAEFSPYGTETGVRTFVGSRSSSVDATFSDHADDCTDNGFPRPQTYVMNLTAIARGEPAIKDFINYVNFSAMADGLVGGVQPNVIFYFPILPQARRLRSGRTCTVHMPTAWQFCLLRPYLLCRAELQRLAWLALLDDDRLSSGLCDSQRGSEGAVFLSGVTRAACLKVGV